MEQLDRFDDSRARYLSPAERKAVQDARADVAARSVTE